MPSGVSASKKQNYKMDWIGNTKFDLNNNKTIDNSEWDTQQGKQFTFYMNKTQIQILVKMLFGM